MYDDSKDKAEHQVRRYAPVCMICTAVPGMYVQQHCCTRYWVTTAAALLVNVFRYLLSYVLRSIRQRYIRVLDLSTICPSAAAYHKKMNCGTQTPQSQLNYCPTIPSTSSELVATRIRRFEDPLPRIDQRIHMYDILHTAVLCVLRLHGSRTEALYANKERRNINDPKKCISPISDILHLPELVSARGGAPYGLLPCGMRKLETAVWRKHYCKPISWF